jgi:hypothetical protein
LAEFGSSAQDLIAPVPLHMVPACAYASTSSFGRCVSVCVCERARASGRQTERERERKREREGRREGGREREREDLRKTICTSSKMCPQCVRVKRDMMYMQKRPSIQANETYTKLPQESDIHALSEILSDLVYMLKKSSFDT